MKKNWHDDAFWGMHFDWHARPEDKNIGRNLTREYMVQFLEELRPDWIQVDCKGHPGISSWPTQLGFTPDDLQTDPLKEYTEAAAELQIPMGIHYSGVIDAAQMKLHPEWAVINADGSIHHESSCCRGAYTEFMISHLEEVLRKYKIRSIWVDGECWGAKLCWCDDCRENFRQQYRLPAPGNRFEAGWDKFLEFHRNQFIRHVKRYVEAIHAQFPDVLICSNWMYSARMPGAVEPDIDYLSGDFDPAWGAARAATESRMFDARKRDFGLSWDLMLWSFAKSFDEPAPVSNVIKPLVQMQQEATEVLAHGGAIMLYDQPERNGRIPEWKRRYYNELHQWCRKYRPYSVNSVGASPVAVLHTVTHMRKFTTSRPEYSNDRQSTLLFDHTFSCQAMEGALHFALESGFSCDIITEDSLDRLSWYRLLIVPEHVDIAPEVWKALEDYVAGGGNVIFSGACMTEQMQQMSGVAFPGSRTSMALYATVGADVLPLPPAWTPVTELQANVTPLQYALSGSCPECDQTDYVLATMRTCGRGKVLGIFGDIFKDYYLGHYPATRRFLLGLVDQLNITMPYSLADHGRRPYIELVARRQKDDLLLHIINRGARETLSTNRPMVSEIVPVSDVEIVFAVDMEHMAVASASEQEVGIVGRRLRIPHVAIYEIIRIHHYFKPA